MEKNIKSSIALLISIGFISFTLSCVAGVKQVQTEKGANALNEVYTSPIVINAVPLTYPFEAAQKGIEGNVTLQFVVTKKGTVKDLIILESSPADVFDQAAIETVTQYIFKPGTKGGEAVDVTVRLPIAFQLSENVKIKGDQKIECSITAEIGSVIKKEICTTKAERDATRERALELIHNIIYRSGMVE